MKSAFDVKLFLIAAVVPLFLITLVRKLTDYNLRVIHKY